jgi:hypothetical protein
MNRSGGGAAILDQAWALLWRQASPYYLAEVLDHGATFGRTVIPPLAAMTVPDIGPVPLYTSATWGNVSITLSSMTLAGLTSIQDHGFTSSADANSVAATVAFGELTFSGSYQVNGTSPARPAVDMAESLAYPDDGAAAVPPGDVDLARYWRDQLLQSENGITLVGKYYDHNETVSRILSQNNGFTRGWPYNAPTNPPSQNTAYYMQMTSEAAAHPENSHYTVGGEDTGYLTHAAYMQGLLIGTCQYYEGTDRDHADDYHRLADDASEFQGYTSPYLDPMTVKSVMSEVKNHRPMTAEELAAVPEPEAVRLGREAAERDFPALQRSALAEQAAREQQAARYQSTGRFSADLAVPTLSLIGAVAVSGHPPLRRLSVALTSRPAEISGLQIALLAGTDPDFTADAQARLDGAPWFQRVLGSRLAARLGSAEVLDYLSGVFNQAIVNVLSY